MILAQCGVPLSLAANLLMFNISKMSGRRWKQVRAALAEIGNEAMQYDADGVDVCFINSPVHKELVKVSDHPASVSTELNKYNQTREEILNVYDQVQPSGASLRILT